MLDERLVDELTDPGSPRAWVEANLGRFVPASAAGRAVPSLEDVKALGELGLILYAVDDAWARGIAATLAPRVAAWEREVDWTAVAARAADRPRAAMVALPSLLWERLTGRPSPARAAVAAADGGDLDVSFARDLAGLGSCEDVAHAAIVRWRPGAWSWGYELTHAVFYATRMGHRPVAFAPRVPATLADLAIAAFAGPDEEVDADLGAELLLALAWAGGREHPVHALGVRRLRALGPTVALPPRAARTRPGGDPEVDAFADRAHPTLVTLAALST